MKAQVDFWLEFNEGYDIGDITQTTRADQTIEIDIQNNSLESFLNNQLVYKIKKAFPTAQTPRLQRIYLITLNPFDGSMAAFLNRPEIANFGYDDSEIILASEIYDNVDLPNDYDDLITGGRNTALDLIKAPLAWKYSTGEDVVIGLSDSKVDINHPDLTGQIIANEAISNTPHGTGVAGIMVANANNNEGIVGLSYNSKIYGEQLGMNKLIELSQVPDVKVINCSWALSAGDLTMGIFYDVIEEVYSNGVLIVGAAGNSQCGGKLVFAFLPLLIKSSQLPQSVID